MKILYTNFHPRNGGGHATYVASLARELRGQHQISVATPGSSRLFQQLAQYPEINLVDTLYSTRVLPMLAELRRLRALLRQQRFDIVHVNGSADHRQVMLARMGLRQPPKIIFTKHNTMPINSFGNKLRARLGTDAAIGVSDFVSNILRASAFGRLPVVTVRHGVDTARFTPRQTAWRQAKRQEYFPGLADDVMVLASVGGTDRAKGWLYLARALARLAPQERERFRLLIAGDHLRGSLLADFQALDISALVCFPGLVPDPENILAAADFGFVLSDHEACSFAACESLASGLPTLVSNAGGLPEVVRTGVDGWIVPVADIDAIEAWLHQRLSQGEVQQMSVQARQRALDLFAMPVFVQQTMNFYKQIL